MPDRWFWRQVAGLLSGLLVSGGCLVIAVVLADNARATVAGLATAAVLLAITAAVAWRRGGFFLRERAAVQRNLSRNQKLMPLWIGLSVLLAAVAPISIKAFVLAAVGAYMLPVIVVVAVRFALRTEEFRRVTE